MTTNSKSENDKHWYDNPLTALGAVLGLIVAFLLTPLAFESSASWVRRYTIEHYWDWLAYPAQWMWFLVVGAGLFFATVTIVKVTPRVVAFAAMLWKMRRF